jgi:hypothetical protein
VTGNVVRLRTAKAIKPDIAGAGSALVYGFPAGVNVDFKALLDAIDLADLEATPAR